MAAARLRVETELASTNKLELDIKRQVLEQAQITAGV
jgi:hypothetical protein